MKISSQICFGTNTGFHNKESKILMTVIRNLNHLEKETLYKKEE